MDSAPQSGKSAEVDSDQIETLIENNLCSTIWEMANILKISKSIKLSVKMKTVVYFTEKNLNGLFGQPNTFTVSFLSFFFALYFFFITLFLLLTLYSCLHFSPFDHFHPALTPVPSGRHHTVFCVSGSCTYTCSLASSLSSFHPVSHSLLSSGTEINFFKCLSYKALCY